MVDTVRTLAALQTLLADNTAQDISPQDMRDFLVSVYPQVDDWTDFTLQNSWAAFGAPYFTPGYRTLTVGSDVLVYTRGVAKSGTFTDATTVATLPSGARPSSSLNITLNKSGAGDPMAWVIASDGTMKVFNMNDADQLNFDNIPPFWAD